MGILELLLLSVGLAMDAFAVSISKGLSLKKYSLRASLLCGVWFGVFQGLMPLIGWLLGSRFEKWISIGAPWIAFILLLIIGINMLREAFGKEEEEDSGSEGEEKDKGGKKEDDLGFKTMLLLAVATSIDALAVGVTFVAVPVTVLPASEFVNTLFAVAVIGVITFAISAAGVRIGALFGSRFKSGSEALGGTILVFIGCKILLEHLDKAGTMQDPGNIFGMLLPLLGTVIGAALVYLHFHRPGTILSRVLMVLAGLIMLGVAAYAAMVSQAVLPSDPDDPFAFLGSFGKIGICVISGFFVQLILDKLVPHFHQNTDYDDGLKSGLKPETKMVLSELLHHAPEGIAIGAVYAASFLREDLVPVYVPLILSAALALHNVPEAILLAAYDREIGAGVHRSFLTGILSGAPVPIFGIVTLILMVLFPAALPFVAPFAAGAVLFIVLESLFPKL